MHAEQSATDEFGHVYGRRFQAGEELGCFLYFSDLYSPKPTRMRPYLRIDYTRDSWTLSQVIGGLRTLGVLILPPLIIENKIIVLLLASYIQPLMRDDIVSPTPLLHCT